MRRGEACGALTDWSVKVAVMVEAAQSLHQVAAASLVKCQNLLRVKKTEISHIAKERYVAGLELEGVGHL